MITSLDTYLGVLFKYEYEAASIEVSNYSDNGVIVFSKFADVADAERFSDYERFAGHKKVSHSDGSFEFSGDSYFWWVTDTPWWAWENRGENLEDDYISFIARIDDKIAGFAVIYIWSNGEEGGGRVLEDVVFTSGIENITTEYVNTEINKVIETHKNSQL